MPENKNATASTPVVLSADTIKRDLVTGMMSWTGFVVLNLYAVIASIINLSHPADSEDFSVFWIFVLFLALSAWVWSSVMLVMKLIEYHHALYRESAN